MGIFFKKMLKKETDNWGKGCILGFYAFLLVLFINQIYDFIFNNYLLSNFVIFSIGLGTAFVWSSILKFIKRKKPKEVKHLF
ncbi:hypothetical protein JCM9157_4474 [Halalkalibacter akibai JCM 9157]|uniref:Uncharacterized protein n=1 Tax=Halalkalibacter akibai (strain ATCC 43226 / DSM 21942 / CIP 109018 / JCM 9157 / 1139) TaxID=1236973 RepID=W4QYP5_HALA3|nr:hypothetical protein JCM9157_4474 [Halalkalibacter akibai JCM 9157]